MSDQTVASGTAASESFVVRVLTREGVVAGVGLLVGDRRIVTCAHVVNAALGRDPRHQEKPSGLIDLDFPLAEPADGRVYRASVLAWVAPPREGAAGDDVAGLERIDGDPPHGAIPARLSVEPPRAGKALRVFGYPGTPPRPNGGWVATTVRGRVGNGRIQLDSGPESALKVQPGFSGGPVLDDSTGRVIGIITEAPPGKAATERDSYAIDAAQLRSAWPQQLLTRPRAARGREVTVLHLSDPQFGKNHIFGGNGLTTGDKTEDTLFARLHTDLEQLAEAPGLRPDLLIVTGDLAEWGVRSEFRQVNAFLAALAEAAELPRRHVALVPGNHDVNRKACSAYFDEQESLEEEPVKPYFPKWRDYAAAFGDFYAEVPGATFTPDEPWTFFEMPDINVVVAGLNSTMAESHLDPDHYGFLGEHQLQWFAERLKKYKRAGWLRIAALHHNAIRGAVLDDENLRDPDDLDRILGAPGLVNLVLHGHTHDAKLHALPSGVPLLSTGSAAVSAEARPGEVPNQYQFLTIRRDVLTRHARQYSPGQRRWIGDTRVSPTGSDWREARQHRFTDIDKALPPRTDGDPPGATTRGSRVLDLPELNIPPRLSPVSDMFLDLVAQAARARHPQAEISERPGSSPPYLRVSRRVPSGVTEFWPIGIIDGPATEDAVLGFTTGVHAQFAASIPQVRSELVHRGPTAPAALVELARQRGVRLRSFTDFQGLLDLSPLADKQREQLTTDRVYPARLYVEQRFTLGDQSEIHTRLIRRAVEWLSAEDARLIVVLGDFGRGKTSFLRELTRRLPQELPSVLPILVELRTLEKAPTLDELLAQHLVRNGAEDVSPKKLRYMIESGRLALLFDGFDELELRVGYDNAADYLQTVLNSVTDHAKLILTSRTQHFRDTAQVRTALGDRVEKRAASRVVTLEEFSDEQVLQFLTNLYAGDAGRARERFDLISGIGNLLDLAHNPRMLAFVAALDAERLESIQAARGILTQAALYREIIDYWLEIEEKRQRHERGLPSLRKEHRWHACTALAHRLWASTNPTIAEQELSAEVANALTDLAELGYTEEQASHAIASGSLLVRTDEGTFRFIHQSVMEWLVADAAASSADYAILSTRRTSRLMASFFIELAGPDTARRWARALLEESGASEVGKRNALDVMLQLLSHGQAAVDAAERLDLSQVDLRGLDLTDLDLSGANLRAATLDGLALTGTNLSGADLTEARMRGLRIDRTSLAGAHLGSADLRGTHLTEADLTGASLHDANLEGVRITGGSLRGADFQGSRWDRAALLGAHGVPDLTSAPELRAAAIGGHDTAEVMARRASAPQSIAFSPDGTLIATGHRTAVEIIDAASGHTVRILTGHASWVSSVAFSPDGTLIATTSNDNTARTWDTATGQPRTTLSGHTRGVTAVAFSPDGTLIATASHDNTARTWDTATGQPRTTLSGHKDSLNAVAFSPDGTLIATASNDNTARTWDSSTGQPVTTFTGHNEFVTGVAFSPDGTLIATASFDNTARTWDTTGQPRTTLTGHKDSVWRVAFSPDGTLIATASFDNTARTWDTTTGELVSTLTGHSGWVIGVAFSPGGTIIGTISQDHSTRTWDAGTGAALSTLTGHDDDVTAVAFSPDGTLVTSSSDNVARAWDTGTGQLARTQAGPQGKVTAIAFSPDGTHIAVTSGDHTAHAWDAGTGEPVSTLTGHSGNVTAVAFSPDGTHLATASSDGTARTWDTASGEPRGTLTGHAAGLTAIAFSPDGTLLATASSDHSARTWDTASGEPRGTLTGHDRTVNSVAFSPDGTHLATASNDNTARTWDTTTGQPILTLTGHDRSVNSVAFSPDGTHLATASNDNTARTWDTTTGQPLSTLTGHSGNVTAVAFSPDGTHLATASNDNTARIWDAATGALLVTLVPLPDGGYATLLPDGGYKLEGDPADRLWWAIKLCRFEAGELDPYVPGIRRLPLGAPVLPRQLG